MKEGSITIPPYAPPQKMQSHLIPPETPRSIFVYFRGLFYDVGNDPEGGYYARYIFLACTLNYYSISFDYRIAIISFDYGIAIMVFIRQMPYNLKLDSYKKVVV